MGKYPKELNKWVCGIEVQTFSPERDGFYPFLRIWFCKRISNSPEGQIPKYKGFIFIFKPLKYIGIIRRCFLK